MKLKPDLLSISIAATLMLVAPQAYAQSAEPALQSAAEALDELPSAVNLQSVTVTARGVSEPLQEMPLPISAVTAQTIEDKGFNDIRDIANFTPSFSFRSAFGRAGDRPVIRGMSNVQGEPNASFFIDGIFVQGDISGFGLENLQRVEVVRGPQSAAFGRRTFSGAVNFITKRPGSDPGGKITIGGGSDGQYKYNGFYSGTLIPETLAFDISLTHRGNDGLFYNPESGRKDVGGTETTGGMASLLWTPVDDLDVIARVGMQKINDQPFALHRMGSENMNCYLPAMTGATIPGAGFPISSDRHKGTYCGTVKSPTQIPLNTDIFRLAGFTPGTERKTLRSSIVVDYRFPNFWSLTSTSAYNENQEYRAFDQDFSADRGFGGAFETITQDKTHDFSQDLRITTDQEKAVYATFGAYYYKQGNGTGYAADLAGFAMAPGQPLFPVVRVPTHPLGKTINKAVYGFINWEINDQWTASLEGRYAQDEISTAGDDRRSLTIDGQQQILSRHYVLDDTFKSFTPRITLGYQWRDNVHVYGLASKGTKPGGFNADVQRADMTESSRDELIALGFEKFDEEKAWNYELGFKSDWLGNRLRVNASAYWIEWDNQQLTAGHPVQLLDGGLFSTSYTTNIGQSRIRGLELESQWNFAEGWLAHLAYSLTDARIVEFINQGQADLFCPGNAPTLNDGDCANAKGNYLPRVPKNHLSLGLMYEGRLANGWGWMVNGDASYESSRTQTENLNFTGSSTRANFRASLDPNANWRLTAFVTNAFGDDTPEDLMGYIDPTAFIAIPQVPPFEGLQVTNRSDLAVTAPNPRMWGVEVSYKF